MLTELVVRDLGVIEEAHLLLGPGLTAVTGETGAGKTLLVEAIDLLVGGRADAALVRSGAPEGVVEGRFVLAGEEVLTPWGSSWLWVPAILGPVIGARTLLKQDEPASP